jgi:hypothetical protein
MLGRIDPTVSKTPTRATPEVKAWAAGADAVSLGAPGELFTPEQASRIRKNAMIGGGALFGLILLISIVKGCGASSPSKPSDKPAVVEPAADDPTPTQVEVATPPLVLDAGVVAPVVDASEAAVAPAVDAAVDEPLIDAPVVKVKPAGTKPVIKKPVTTPKPKPRFDPNRPLPRR